MKLELEFFCFNKIFLDIENIKGDENWIFQRKTHLRISELLPELVADLALLGAPNKYPVHFICTVRMGPTTQVAARVLEVGPTASHMATNL